MRKRSLSRMDVTLVKRSTSGDFTYYNVKGLVQPPAEFYNIQHSSFGTSTEDKIELFTADSPITYPNHGGWGIAYGNVIYTVTGRRVFDGYGKNDNTKHIALYESDSDYWTGATTTSIDWGNMSRFIQAVESTEVAVELQLARVLNN